MYDIVGLLAIRHSRWGWIVGLVVLVLTLIWLVAAIDAAQPDVSGTPGEIALRWNRAAQGLPVTAEGRALRGAFLAHLDELGDALAHDDEDAADDARDRITEDFRALGRLRVRHGLAD